MRTGLALLLASLATPVAGAAQPAPPAESGLVLAARIGYGVPFGSVARGDTDVDEVVHAKLPLWLELGYRFNRRVRGQLFCELAPSSVAAGSCAPGMSCSAWDARFGLAVQFRLAPSHAVDPWVGVGFGVEVLNAHVRDPLGPPARIERSWAGIELPLLDGGVDVRASSRVSLGPYVSLSLAEFTSTSTRPDGGTTVTGAIDERASHGWVQLGLRASLAF